MLRLDQWTSDAVAHGASPHEARESFYKWLHEPLAALSSEDELMRMVTA